MGKLPGEIDGRRFLRALSRLGWEVESYRGSHIKLVHVAFHGVIRRNAVLETLKIAGVTVEEFLDAL